MLGSLIEKFRASRKRKYLLALESKGMKLGTNFSCQDGVFLDSAHCYLISIGDDVNFAPNVRLIAHDASTKRFLGYTRIGKISIGDHCFLGDGVTVLPGVTIGDRCIIGAGSVVTKSIPENSVAVGIPAKVISTTDEYLDKIRQQKNSGTPYFDASYHIWNLTPEKKAEVIKACETGICFMD